MSNRIVKRETTKITKKRLFIFLGVIVLLIGFFNAGRFLSLTEPPKHADVIIVLSGGTGRVEKAAELYKEGYAPAILHLIPKR